MKNNSHEQSNGKKYKTIVIDPPWEVETGNNSKDLHSPIPELPYKTMSLDEIKDFPINDFADDNCMLFLWTIQKYIKSSFEIIESWGFKFNSLLSWNKLEGMNHGGFTRNVEYVLFCYRGKYDINTNTKFMPQCFTEKRTKHSKKPNTFYNHLLRLTPEPRIDIFARMKRVGFDSFGNEAEEPLTLENYA